MRQIRYSPSDRIKNELERTNGKDNPMTVINRITKSAGFYVDGKAWKLAPNPKYYDNPPDSWEECGCCDGYHPADYDGDCRSDINRWPSYKCLTALTEMPHRYELHRSNTHETDESGHRYRWCVYDYFNVQGHKGISFWYFVTKQDARKSYPELTEV
jgi:hypothetical protein